MNYKTILAFAIIYLVWGTTFLAIRIGVNEVPPLLFAAMRFGTAGLALYLYQMLCGESCPNRKQWSTAFFLAFFIFVLDYGLLFWAEQRVPSGITAVMMATIPLFVTLSEVVFLRTQRFSSRLVLGLLTGLVGIATLMSRSLKGGGTPIDILGGIALLVASIGWSISSVLTRKLTLPRSKVMSSGIQMLAGGLMLTILAAVSGELHAFDIAKISYRAWIALVYLIGPGSIVGFTAYSWLIQHESPSRVATYAYVNPLVAVIVGYFIGGEALGERTALGALCILISVIIITTTSKSDKAPPHFRHSAAK